MLLYMAELLYIPSPLWQAPYYHSVCLSFPCYVQQLNTLSIARMQSIGHWFIGYTFNSLMGTSSCVCIKSHSWSAKKQLHRQQSVFETSRHLTLSEDKSRQCETPFAFHHKTQISGCLIPFLLTGTTVTLYSLERLSRDHSCHGRSKPGC